MVLHPVVLCTCVHPRLLYDLSGGRIFFAPRGTGSEEFAPIRVRETYALLGQFKVSIGKTYAVAQDLRLPLLSPSKLEMPTEICTACANFCELDTETFSGLTVC